MKILFILPEFIPHPGGGISTYYQHYIDALIPFCEDIKVIVGSGYLQDDKDFMYQSVSVEYLKPQNFRKFRNLFSKYDMLPEFRNNLSAAWAMYHQARGGEGYDVIECTDFGIGHIPWVLRHERPVVTRLHGSSGQINTHELVSGLADSVVKQAELLTLPLCDLLLTHSKANRDFWANELPCAIEHVDPVYNPANPPNNAVPFERRENFGLVTARIQRWKGPEQLCKAFTLLQGGTANIKWYGRDMIFGHAMSTGEYLSQHYPLIWKKHILPNKPLPNEQVNILQRQVKFGLVPSVWDMFNFSCVEFLASGTPVICSEGAGSSALIEHGHNGYTYAAEDGPALAACIDSITALNEEAYNKMAAACMATVRNRLSPALLMPRYLDNYERLLAAFKKQKKRELLENLYGPSEKTEHISDLLDQQPVKGLMHYMIKRAKGKILK